MKIPDFVKKLEIAIVLLTSFVAVSLFKEVTIGSALFCLSLTAFCAFKQYMEHIKKPDPNIRLQEELNTLKHTIGVIKMNNSVKPKIAEDTKSGTPVRYF